MKERVIKRIPALILSVIIVMAMMPILPGGMQEAYAATTLTPGSTATLSNDTVYAIEEDGTYTFSGSSSSNQGGIAVKDGVHAVIILNDVSITNCFNPLYISGTAGTVVDLVLVGTNTFEGANRHFNSYNEKKDNSNPYSGGSAGIYVPESAVLNISGSGSLTASGGPGTGCYYGSGGGAGIGTNGSYHYSLDRSFASKCGTINIFSGNITANGNKGQDLSVSYGAAGIGGGGGSGSDRDLIDFGASDGGTITVYGGTVTAAGSEGGEGIGHGAQYSGNRRDLSSGTLAVSGSATVTSNGTPVSQSETVSAPTVSPQEVFFHDTAPDYTVASSAGTASPSFRYYKKNTVTIGGETVTYYEQVSQKPDQIGKYCVCEVPDNKTKLPLLAEFEIKSGYRINYHLNGGTNASSNPSGYTIGTEDITLADPTKEGYAFAGWYDNAEFSGEKVTKIASGSTGDKDLYAQWTQNAAPVTPSEPSTYEPTVTPSDNGQTTVDKKDPEAGETVKITPTPNDGYEVDTVTVTDKDGKPVDVTKNEDGTWSFTQPAGSVTITVTYKKKDTPVTPVVTTDPILNLKAVPTGNTVEKLTWTKVKGAEGYDVYFAKCGNKFRKIKSTRALTLKKKGLKKGSTYKYKVCAYKTVDGKKVYIASAYVSHAIAGGYNSRYTDAKSITAAKKSVTLETGKTVRVKATQKKYKSGRKFLKTSHAALFRYKSTDKSVATVDKYGNVTAKKAGTCTIYIYSQCGIWASTKVTVK